jgi:hypothetical protein
MVKPLVPTGVAVGLDGAMTPLALDEVVRAVSPEAACRSAPRQARMVHDTAMAIKTRDDMANLYRKRSKRCRLDPLNRRATTSCVREMR